MSGSLCEYENVGNAKLESEKLIQQVFIMHACEILVFNSKICVSATPSSISPCCHSKLIQISVDSVSFPNLWKFKF
jgi:hypothetical protein